MTAPVAVLLLSALGIIGYAFAIWLIKNIGEKKQEDIDEGKQKYTYPYDGMR